MKINKLLFFLSCLLMLGVGMLTLPSCGLSRQVNKAINSKDAKSQLYLADTLFERKKYNYSKRLYENVLPFFRTDKEYSNILYKYGLCSYYMEDYQTAIAVFSSLRDNVPNFTRKEELSFLIVKAFHHLSEPHQLHQQNTEQSISEATQFMSLHPNSTYQDSTLRIIAKNRKTLEEKAFRSAHLYYTMGFYKSAVIGFQALLLDFPETERADYFHYMLIKASDKLLASTIEEKRKEREIAILTAITNFEEQFPDSRYIKEVAAISVQLNKDLKKNQAN